MDERLEQRLKQCEVLVASGNPDDMDQFYNLLKEIFLKERSNLARFAQELAAYNGGSVLRRIWKGALGTVPYNAFTSIHILAIKYIMTSTMVLSLLSASKVFVEGCLKKFGEDERQTAREMYLGLSTEAMMNARSLTDAEEDWSRIVDLWVIPALECLANFAKHSRVFREALKDVAQDHNIFVDHLYLLSPDSHSKLSPNVAWHTRSWLSSLSVSLAYSADSRMWALDKGVLTLVEAILARTPTQEVKCGVSDTLVIGDASPVFRCINVIVHLLQSEDATEVMRARNTLSALEPHKQKIKDMFPGHQLWLQIEARLRGLPTNWSRVPARFWKVEAMETTGRLGYSLVCSWKLCTAGPEPVVGKKYGKCSQCQVARYCSKDHQTLHWPSHKQHCKAAKG